MFKEGWLENLCFSWLHQNHLIYVTCWEDPRLDRIAMELKESDTVLAIASAGCNVLDYALERPKHIYAVDANFRQNALLELKIAGIRALDFESFFKLFGEGRLANFEGIYRQKLRSLLSPPSQEYWDRHGARLFDSNRSFYFRGTTGNFALIINYYIDKVVKLRGAINALLEAKNLEEQQEIYDRDLRDSFWKNFLRKFTNSDIALWLLGVPLQQRQQIERYIEGGVGQFIQRCCEKVFTQIPIQENYFWRVFIKGRYSQSCCPEYLKKENFEALKSGLVDRISVSTETVTEFLEQNDVSISHFVLLDHMDWLSNYSYADLEREWQAIVSRASEKARVLFRSGGLKVEYVDPISVKLKGRDRRLGDLLVYNNQLAEELHQQDRVQTYGSFYIADLAIA